MTKDCPADFIFLLISRENIHVIGSSASDELDHTLHAQSTAPEQWSQTQETAAFPCLQDQKLLFGTQGSPP
jgi:hypothetical protein